MLSLRSRPTTSGASRPTCRASRSRTSRASSASIPATIIKLASNENPRGPSAAVLAAVAAAAADLTRYPDGNAFALKAELARRTGLDPAQIVLGNGSNDILELATQAFLRPGERTVYAQHAFAVYPLATQARGGIGIEVPAVAYGHDLPAMRAAITPTRGSCSSPTPTIPTGTWIAPAPLEAFIASVPRDVLVVLDEAYNEYLDPADRADSNAWVRRYPNLLVSRTFSKAYGLAALRVGYGVMHADGGRCAQSRAAAVQRQLARAGRGARGARRRALRGREPGAQSRGPAPAGRGLRSARPVAMCRRTRTSCW